MTKDMQKISRATRNNPNCHCEICRLGSSTSSTKAVRVETNKYFLAGGGVQGCGQPSNHRKDSPTVVCSLCLSQLGKGKAHHCSPKTHLMTLQQSLSPTSKDKITGSNIRERRMKGQGQTSFPRLEGGHPEQALLRTQEPRRDSMLSRCLMRQQVLCRLLEISAWPRPRPWYTWQDKELLAGCFRQMLKKSSLSKTFINYYLQLGHSPSLSRRWERKKPLKSCCLLQSTRIGVTCF